MDRWPTQRLALIAAALLAAAPAAAQTPINDAPPKSAGKMAILIRNPNTSNGEPPYALADQFGHVQRLVEPSPGMRLAPHVGQTVRIRHDSGDILLASQLDFSSHASPRAPGAEPSSVLRAVSPAQFIPPRKVSRIETALSTDEPGQRYVVVPVQLVDRLAEGADRYVDASESDPTEPIDLDQILDGEAAGPDLSDDTYADELPSPESDRLEPIPSGEVLPEYTLNEATGSHHAADCPHCQGQPKKPYSRYDNDCPHCNTAPCPTCHAPKGFCGPSCNPASRRGIYGRVEYLLWTFDGMDTPPLVTTNTQGGAPILGVPGTQIVYGGDLLDGTRNGLRFTIGGWLDNNRDVGIEASLTSFETETEVYNFSDLAGTSVLGRPFYNTSPIDPNDNELPPADDVQLISFPNAVAGSLNITARSRFRMGGILLRTGLCCREIGGGCGPCNCPSCQGGGGLLGLRKGARPRAISRVDFLVGYRHADLEEELIFNENDVTLIGTSTPSSGGTVDVNEGFEVDNDFHGIDLGVGYEWLSRRWGLELLSKVALGNTRQRVSIYGSNTIGANGVVGVTSPGGLLAQTSNIGVYERDQFSILPELSARLSYRVTERFSLSAGYTLVYWANVVRPGDHIDFSVNGGLASNPLYNATAYTHPRFDWDETSYWGHGLNLGAELSY